MVAATLVDGVRFIAVSAGTATFAFGSSYPSFLTPAQAVTDGLVADGNTVSYVAFYPDVAPTQRAWGHGVFHSAGGGTITRPAETGTSGVNTLVNFAGAPTVALTALAEDFTFRTRLQADANYYVATTGSNGNPGTLAAPFKDLQYAYDHLASTLDLALFSVTIHCAASATAYTLSADALWVGGDEPGGASGGVSIIGAGSTTTTITDFTVDVGPGMVITLDDFAVTATNNSYGVSLYALGLFMILGPGLDFKSASVAHIYLDGLGTQLQISNGYTISSSAQAHWFAAQGGEIFTGAGVFTLVGNLSFSAAFAVCLNDSAILSGFADPTFVGTATGQRFQVAWNSILVWNFPNTFTLPGDQPGMIGEGGIVTELIRQVVNVPSSGNTVAMTLLQPTLLLNPAGALAALTVDLPPIPATSFLFYGRIDGQTAAISTTKTITSLIVVSTDGSAVLGAPTTLTAGTAFKMIYDLASNTWYPTT